MNATRVIKRRQMKKHVKIILATEKMSKRAFKKMICSSGTKKPSLKIQYGILKELKKE